MDLSRPGGDYCEYGATPPDNLAAASARYRFGAKEVMIIAGNRCGPKAPNTSSRQKRTGRPSPTRYDEIFAREPSTSFDTHIAIDGDDGRFKLRRHAVSRNVGWLTTARRFRRDAQ
jgi:hypothetical protein